MFVDVLKRYLLIVWNFFFGQVSTSSRGDTYYLFLFFENGVAVKNLKKNNRPCVINNVGDVLANGGLPIYHAVDNAYIIGSRFSDFYCATKNKYSFFVAFVLYLPISMDFPIHMLLSEVKVRRIAPRSRCCEHCRRRGSAAQRDFLLPIFFFPI